MPMREIAERFRSPARNEGPGGWEMEVLSPTRASFSEDMWGGGEGVVEEVDERTGIQRSRGREDEEGGKTQG